MPTNAHYAGGVTISNVTIRSIWHNSAADFFCVLENFRRKFANLVAPSTDGSTKRLVRCKVHPINSPKDGGKSIQIDP